MKTYPCSALYSALVLSLFITQAGCQNVLGFSTATKFGLDVSQRSDQMIDVTMGYDRSEVASIPAPKDQDASGPLTGQCDSNSKCLDTYSVLGTFEVDYGNPFFKPLEINQFFATGMAARAAAKKKYFQKVLGTKAGEYIKQPHQSDEQKPKQTQQQGGVQ